MNRDIRVRKARIHDIDRIMDIENEQFKHPWKRNYFVDELDHDIAWFYVAEDTAGGAVMGYIIFWIIEETMELHNIAVSGSVKGKGVGYRLFQFLLQTARQRQVQEVFLEVRTSNAEARTFYEKQGFEQIALRKEYYNEPIEDAAIYKLIVPPAPAQI